MELNYLERIAVALEQIATQLIKNGERRDAAPTTDQQHQEHLALHQQVHDKMRELAGAEAHRKRSEGAKKGIAKRRRGPDGRLLPHEPDQQPPAADQQGPASLVTLVQEFATVPRTVPIVPSPAQAVIAAYCEAFKARYGTNPPIDGKAAGTVRNLLKSLPANRLCLLVQAYLQMDERWFQVKAHDLVTFSQNLTKVSVCLDGGRQTLEKTWEDVIDEQDKGTLLEQGAENGPVLELDGLPNS